MCTTNGVKTGGAAGLRRMAVLSLVSIPIAAEVILGEILFVGHIVILVEAIGFAWGIALFMVIWAALGVAVLAGRDHLWPRLTPVLDRMRTRFAGSVKGVLAHSAVRALLVLLVISAVALAVGLVVALAGEWLADHSGEVATFLIAAAIVFALLLVIARIGRAIERWVRRVADSAGRATRLLATLVTMVVLGPALSWLLFRLLGYSDRTTYALTVAAAPVFGIVWVPFYALGVWELLQGLL